jgi:hypothetical protein
LAGADSSPTHLFLLLVAKIQELVVEAESSISFSPMEAHVADWLELMVRNGRSNTLCNDVVCCCEGHV